MNSLKKIIKRFAPHRKEYYKDRLFRRVNEKKLADVLESAGVSSGQVIYIQSAFSRLGYYPNGGERFIRLLKNMVGPRGTIVMPCFPTIGAMADYVKTGPVYNALTTPCKIGVLPELLRLSPGARRSCHPTHPVTALGYLADEIIAGHEYCVTPQGDGSPFDKVVQAGALILRIGTPANPLTHRLQEAANIPNLFLKDSVPLDCVNDSGKKMQVKTRVYRKQVPFVVFLPGDGTGNPVGTNVIDLPILFESRENGYRRDTAKKTILPQLFRYRDTFEKEGLWKHAHYNGCPIDAYPADKTMDFAVTLVKQLVNRYAELYKVEPISKAVSEGKIKL